MSENSFLKKIMFGLGLSSAAMHGEHHAHAQNQPEIAASASQHQEKPSEVSVRVIKPERPSGSEFADLAKDIRAMAKAETAAEGKDALQKAKATIDSWIITDAAAPILEAMATVSPDGEINLVSDALDRATKKPKNADITAKYLTTVEAVKLFDTALPHPGEKEAADAVTTLEQKLQTASPAERKKIERALQDAKAQLAETTQKNVEIATRNLVMHTRDHGSGTDNTAIKPWEEQVFRDNLTTLHSIDPREAKSFTTEYAELKPFLP